MKNIIFSEKTKEKFRKIYGTSIQVSSLNNKLLYTFYLAIKTGEFFNCDYKKILKYAQSDKIFQDKYILSIQFSSEHFLLRSKNKIIFIYLLDYKYLLSFNTSRETGKHFNINNSVIMRYTKSGKIYKEKYILLLKKFIPDP